MHYSSKQLSDYIKNTLDPESQAAIDEHLLTCDVCMDSLLLLISDTDIAQAEEIVPADFVKAVMSEAEQQKRAMFAKKQKKSNSVWSRSGEILPYYIAAAVLTIFLSGSGIFNDVFAGLKTSGTMGEKAPQTFLAKLKIDARFSQVGNGINDFAEGLFVKKGGVPSEQ